MTKSYGRQERSEVCSEVLQALQSSFSILLVVVVVSYLGYMPTLARQLVCIV